MGDDDGDNVSAARYGIAAPARIVKGEIALVPGDKDHGIAVPGARVHDRINGMFQEGITCCDELLHLAEITWIRWSTGSSMHIMALVGAYPGIIRHIIAGKVGVELAEVYDMFQALRIILHILVGDKRVMLALVKLVATRGSQDVTVTERERLHVCAPALAPCLKLVNDVGNVDSDIAITGHPVGRARGSSDIVWLAGMCHPKILRCQPIG